ncbi:hypothetical protein CJ030_MR6G018863 [Morella rubra]|uniref:Uncharacterized protein n=1 Tax=Morella rubra TaxID=262757 RepID=A0A6A1V9J5_9ROSI|nr:hypothetical protein CJ030_MR6G018863 [Morella rubra]
MVILVEKIVMLPLMLLISQGVRNLFSYYLLDLEASALILLQQMLPFFMIVTEVHKLICKPRTVLTGLVFSSKDSTITDDGWCRLAPTNIPFAL